MSSGRRALIGRATRCVPRSAFVVGSVVLWLLHPETGLASFELDPVDPRERGSATLLAVGITGGSSKDGSPRGALHPPLPESLQSEVPTAARFYAFKPFGIREIDFAAVAVEIPICMRIRSLAVSYQRLAALSYTEEVYLLSARVATLDALIEPTIRFGVVRDGESFGDHACLIDLRAETWALATVKVAAQVKNILGSGLVGEGSRCPTRVSAGVGLAVSDCLGFGVEVGKESGLPVCVASGVEFEAAGGFVVRAGTKTYPRGISFGVGLRRGPLALDVGSSVDLELGATHEAGVALLWK